MFDISWSEFLLIGVVALVVIGPKELPGVMRTLGQWTRKVRGMAYDFQSQFQEAMREAEMADLKKQVDEIAHDVKQFDPLKDVRADVENVGRDVERSLAVTPAAETPVPVIEPPLALTQAPEETVPVPVPEPAALPPQASSPHAPISPKPASGRAAPEMETLGAGAGSAPQPAEKPAPSEDTGHGG